MMRKIFLTFLGTAGVALVVAMSMAWNFEKLDSLIQKEVKTLSDRGVPVRLSVGKAFVRLLPLEITINNIHVEPLGEIGEQVMPLDVGAVTVRPSLWHLMVGKIHISNLIVKDSEVQLKIKEQKSNNEPNYDVFSFLSQVPVSRLELQNISVFLKTKVESQWIEAKLNSIHSTLVYDPDFINLTLKVHEVTGSLDGTDIIQKGFFETRFILTRKNIVLTDFKLKESNSFLVAAGTTQLDLKKKTFGKGNINIRSETSSEKVRFIYKIITKKEKTPLDKIQTMFRGDVRLSLDSKIENIHAQVEAALFNFQVEKFRVGNLMTKATYDGKEKKIQIQEARISNNGITAFTKSTTLNLENLTLAPVDISVKMFHLKDYIQYSLNNKLTSDVHAEADANCGGTLDPLKIVCKGQVIASNIQVNRDRKSVV